MTNATQMQQFGRLVGTWTTEATHPMVPGVVVHGTATFEWLEGERFLIVRSDTDHPDFPGAISVIGNMDTDRVAEGADAASGTTENEPLRMHYFDTRGVFRVNEVEIDGMAWRWWRMVPGFSQRFTGTFTDDGNTIDGLCELRRDDVHWKDDLRIVYRRKR